MNVLRASPSTWSAIAVLVLVCLVPLAFIAGCTSPQPTPTPTATPTATTPPAQKITLSGSTTVFPLAEKAREAFEAKNPNTEIQISAGGSSVGVKGAGEGTVDIGMSSRDLKPEEVTAYPTLVKTTVCYDAILIIVHPTNTIQSLSLAQVRGIYNGSITNWNQVGGASQEIVVVARDSASGTREYFKEAVMKNENFTTRQIEFNSNGGVQQQVSQTPQAIGYVGLAFTNGVKPLPIIVNGTPVQGTVANVLNKSYPVSRPLFMLTRGQPAGLAKQYIDFILSAEGQQIVLEEGFVPLA